MDDRTIAGLREERDAANAALARYYVTPTVAGLQSDLATLRERLDKMAMRFRDYGEHTEACDSWSGVSADPSGCSCGFTAAWYAAFPEDKPAVAVIRGEEKNAL